MDKQYSISEASALVAVEPHVLRYWEEELEIDIRRNEMGHRCYLEKDVKILQRVKTLKDKGIQLKAIKEVVHRMYELLDEQAEPDDDDTLSEHRDIHHTDAENSRVVDFKMAQFQNLMDKVVSNSIKENLKVITQSVATSVTGDVVKQMDVLMKEKEEQEEARYRKLDATIRELQTARSEAAAAEAVGMRRRLFRKKR